MGDENGKPLSRDLDYKGKMLETFCSSLCLSCFSSRNFCNLSQDYLCNFLTNFFSYVHFGDKKQQRLVCRKQNEESLYFLLVVDMPSPLSAY
jgi:hypothetical protein